MVEEAASTAALLVKVCGAVQPVLHKRKTEGGFWRIARTLGVPNEMAPGAKLVQLKLHTSGEGEGGILMGISLLLLLIPNV